MYSGSDVSHTNSNESGSSVRIAGHVHQARKRLCDHVIAGLVRKRSLASEGRERSHNEARIDSLERIVIQTALLHHAGTEVFDHDIHLGHQRAENLERFRLAEVQAQALLATILLDEIATAAVFDRWQQPRRIAHRRQLD